MEQTPWTFGQSQSDWMGHWPALGGDQGTTYVIFCSIGLEQPGGLNGSCLREQRCPGCKSKKRKKREKRKERGETEGKERKESERVFARARSKRRNHRLGC